MPPLLRNTACQQHLSCSPAKRLHLPLARSTILLGMGYASQLLRFSAGANISLGTNVPSNFLPCCMGCLPGACMCEGPAGVTPLPGHFRGIGEEKTLHRDGRRLRMAAYARALEGTWTVGPGWVATRGCSTPVWFREWASCPAIWRELLSPA